MTTTIHDKAMRELLAFYQEAGVDVAVGEAPVDRLAEPEIAPAPPPSPPPLPMPELTRPKPPPTPVRTLTPRDLATNAAAAPTSRFTSACSANARSASTANTPSAAN